MAKRLLLISISVAFVLAPRLVHAQDASEDISAWISISPPKPEWLTPRPEKHYQYTEPGVAYYTANYSKHEWEVFVSEGRVFARERINRPRNSGIDKPPFDIPVGKGFYGSKRSIKVEDGWLIDFNGGEFGASLWWFSDDGNEKYKIYDDHIIQFIDMEGGLYALEGLAHMSISEGKLIYLVKEGAPARWTSRVVADLPQAPDIALLLKDGSLIVVTTSGLIRIGKDEEIETMLENTFWSGLYPNSIVIDENNYLYIGMRQGIAKWRIGDSPDSMQWLVPSKEYLKEELDNFNNN